MTIAKALIAAVFLVAAVPAVAKDKSLVPEQLDPAKAYVLVEIRNVDEGKLPGSFTIARYDAEKGDVRGGTRSPDTALPKDDVTRTLVGGKPIIKTKQSRLYFFALPADRWVIEGAQGTAFSLGSSSFALAAGQITDLGVAGPATDWREGEGPEKFTAGKIAGMMMFGAFAKRDDPTPAMLTIRERGPEDLAIPAEVSAKGVVRAEFVPGAKFGNYLGGLVNRMTGRAGRTAPAAANVPAEPAAPDAKNAAPTVENP